VDSKPPQLKIHRMQQLRMIDIVYGGQRRRLQRTGLR